MKSRTWDFIGIVREPPRRWHPQQHQLTRWRIPFIGCGGISTRGSGFWRILGLWYKWEDRSSIGYASDRTLHIWRLVAICYEARSHLKPVRPGFTVTFAKVQWPIRGVR